MTCCLGAVLRLLGVVETSYTEVYHMTLCDFVIYMKAFHHNQQERK